MAIDKRKYPRYAFSNSSRISAQLILPSSGSKIEAKLLNISLGGVGIAVEKTVAESVKTLEKNAELIFHSINGPSPLASLEGQKMQIRWILNYDPLKNLGIGCEFTELTESRHNSIVTLLENI